MLDELDPNPARSCFQSAGAHLAPLGRTMQSLVSQAQRRLPTGLPSLDAALRGGLGAGTLTEIVGPNGAGKTQFALMMCARTWAASRKGVVYLDTEGSFSAQRLRQIHCEVAGVPATHVDVREMLSATYVFRISTTEELIATIGSLRAHVIQHSTGLIVLDSVAAVVRRDFSGESSSIFQRQEALSRVAAMLKAISEHAGIVTLITNQVMSGSAAVVEAFDGETSLAGKVAAGGNFSPGGEKEEREKTQLGEQKLLLPQRQQPSSSNVTSTAVIGPALGTLWAHCVNTRIAVCPTSLCGGLLVVAKSALCHVVCVPFLVTAQGIVECQEARRDITHQDEMKFKNLTDPRAVEMQSRVQWVPEFTDSRGGIVRGGI